MSQGTKKYGPFKELSDMSRTYWVVTLPEVIGLGPGDRGQNQVRVFSDKAGALAQCNRWRGAGDYGADAVMESRTLVERDGGLWDFTIWEAFEAPEKTLKREDALAKLTPEDRKLLGLETDL